MGWPARTPPVISCYREENKAVSVQSLCSNTRKMKVNIMLSKINRLSVQTRRILHRAGDIYLASLFSRVHQKWISNILNRVTKTLISRCHLLNMFIYCIIIRKLCFSNFGHAGPRPSVCCIFFSSSMSCVWHVSLIDFNAENKTNKTTTCKNHDCVFNTILRNAGFDPFLL